mmetsp:Transcript_8434/g.15094  ORF Transcript_8434/g.15094 Transcript_8434/m.15094 type:complete len:493 (+) Transcript_8434:174-1652(+)
MPPIHSRESRHLVKAYKKSVIGFKNQMRRFILTEEPEDKPDMSALVNLAHEAAAKERFDDAVDLIKEAMMLGANTADVFEFAAECYVQKDEPDKAIDMYTRSLELDPLKTEMYHSRGNCFLLLDEPDRAVDEFEKFLKMEEPMFDLLLKTARACLDAERFERAEELLSMALEINDQDPYIYYNFGELYEKTGDNAKANEFFGKVTQRDPDFPTPYLSQAEQELEDGNLELALQLFQSILKMLPQSAEVYLNCAEIYLQLGEEFANNALTCMTKAIEVDKGEDSSLLEGIYVKRGLLLFDNFSDIDGAIVDFSLCLSTNPTNDAALEYRPVCYRQRDGPGDLEKAKDDYLVLVGLEKVEKERKRAPHVFIAEFYFAKGNYTASAKHYTDAWLCGMHQSMLDADKVSFALMAAFLDGESVVDAEDPTGEAVKKVPPLQHMLMDNYYMAKKGLEPTAHTDLFYQFDDRWGPYRTNVATKLEELINPAGKKGAKKK